MRIPPVDIAIALGLLVAGEAEVWVSRYMIGTGAVTGSRPVLGVTTAAMALALALRRTAPLAVAAVVGGLAACQGLATTPTQGLTSLAIFAVAAAAVGGTSIRQALTGLAVMLAGAVPQVNDASDWAFVAAIVSAAWAAGLIVQRRGAAVRVAEADRDAAAAAERLRIARELHDIVAHRVTSIVVQAQAAQSQSSDVQKTFASIEATARSALAELRDLLGVLRDSDDPGRAPQPTLADIRSLVDDARASGLPVQLTVTGTPYEVEPGLGLAAYRIVQEALTNAMKHAASAPAVVALAFEDGALRVEVRDEGKSAERGDRGHGLAGMRERVSLYGGALTAGRGAKGGFVVTATLPTQHR